jgi:multiple sugar transport system substrate-binding protein
MATHRGKALSTLMLLGVVAAAVLLPLGCSSEDRSGVAAAQGEYLKWRDDGSADLITFEDKEVIHLSKEQLGTMFGKGQQPFAGQRIAVCVLNSGPKGGISGPLYRIRPAWEELTGAKLDIAEIPIAEQLNKTMTDLRLGGGQFDGFIEAAWYMGEYITPGFIVPVDEYMADKRFPQWDPHWMPPALQAVYTWEGKWYAVLNDSDGQVLYWRNDILASPAWQKQYKDETGKDMPFPVKTWQDVVDIAKFFHGKNWDASDAAPDTGIVMHFRVNEQGMFHFMSLSAPFVVLGGERVSRGTNNYWFDPETMEPLINQPGHVRALEVLYELSQYGPSAQSAWDLGTAWDWFLRGKSIFVFSWGDVGALVQDETRSKIKGKLGAAILPGSSEVYDMNQRRWLKLDPPHVVGNTVGGSWHGVISAKSKNPDVVYSLYALMATEPFSLWNVNRGWTGVDPGAQIHFLPPDGTATLQGYLDAGWNESDLKFYLKAYHDNFYAKAMLPYLRINGAEEYWRALDQNLSETMIGRLKPKDALDRTAKEWDEITNRRGRQQQLEQYQRSIGYKR